MKNAPKHTQKKSSSIIEEFIRYVKPSHISTIYNKGKKHFTSVHVGNQPTVNNEMEKYTSYSKNSYFHLNKPQI